MSDIVLLERPSPAIAIVRLNRPQVRNALNLAVRQDMADIFRSFVDDTDLRCVILTGDQDSFAAGADILDMSQIDAVTMYKRHTERLWEAVGDCPVPVI
ncbi:MAG: enoyl-CoA hydratase-related protein, partial [Nitratireductor sp.]